jgi:hypothetical protein
MALVVRARAPDPLEAAMIEDGLVRFCEILPAGQVARVLDGVRATRTFGPDLFLSEAAFDADPQFKGVNPRPGRNLAERFDADLAFVLAAPAIDGALRALLGADYRVLDRKFVCGVPESWLPSWLLKRIAGNPVNNLGAYVRPEFRDVTYFYGIDFHQDLIDHPARTADFVTLYVYLHPVTRADAPLHVLPGSHRFGATVFPHDLERLGEGRWRYGDGRGASAILSQHVLTGAAGFAALWHACTLHGTQPDTADRERISLRYVIARGDAARAGIDRVNESLAGPLALAATREDLDASGAARIKANAIAAA